MCHSRPVVVHVCRSTAVHILAVISISKSVGHESNVPFCLICIGISGPRIIFVSVPIISSVRFGFWILETLEARMSFLVAEMTYYVLINSLSTSLCYKSIFSHVMISISIFPSYLIFFDQQPCNDCLEVLSIVPLQYCFSPFRILPGVPRGEQSACPLDLVYPLKTKRFSISQILFTNF